MIRGEFIRADGLVIPNNITTYGVNALFQWALRDSGYALHIGLANCTPDPLLQIEDLNEPTIGVNGYARQSVDRDDGWPTDGLLNGEQFFETESFIFVATGAGFDKPINRLVLVNHATNLTGNAVVALSGPLPAEIQILATTPEINRTFKYRIYGR